MLRTTRAAFAAACAGACLLAAGAAEAQWGPGYGATYLHAPGYGGFGYGLTTGSRYSLYGPSYGYAAPGYGLPAPGYGYAVPGYGAGPSACGCSTGYAAPAYAPLAAPVTPYGGYYTRRHGEMTYDVYGPYGKQEINYEYHRNGTVSVDVDD